MRHDIAWRVGLSCYNDQRVIRFYQVSLMSRRQLHSHRAVCHQNLYFHFYNNPL
jgi:hypothetical protein